MHSCQCRDESSRVSGWTIVSTAQTNRTTIATTPLRNSVTAIMTTNTVKQVGLYTFTD